MVATKTYGSIAQVKGSHLVIEPLGDELVAFDRRTNRAHMLDSRATAIYRAAENGCSIDALLGLVDGNTREERHAAAQLGILDLERAGLVMGGVKAIPRRRLLRTLGAAAALPMVISIVAPSPAAAASNVPDHGLCTSLNAGTGVDTCATPGRACRPNAMGVMYRCCDPNANDDNNGDGAACATNMDCCSNMCMGWMNGDPACTTCTCNGD